MVKYGQDWKFEIRNQKFEKMRGRRGILVGNEYDKKWK
jgi:hypothetical protein